MNQLYTTKEVADILKVTQRTIYNYIDSGQLRAQKIGKAWRISSESLKEFINAGTDETYTDYIKGEL